MRVNGLTLIYKDGINTVLSNNSASYPVGDLLCRIFQGETLYNISRIVRNCVSVYPMQDILLSQDEIEQAEDYILQSLMYTMCGTAPKSAPLRGSDPHSRFRWALQKSQHPLVRVLPGFLIR